MRKPIAVLACLWAGAAFATVSDVVNVKDHGARGDCTSDDTAALSAAIAVVVARSTIDPTDYGQGSGGRVFLPRGCYLVTAGFSWTADGIVIEGEGAGASAIKVAMAAKPTTTDLFRVGDGSGAGRRVHFKDLSIFTDRNFGTDRVRDFIHIDGSSWPKLTNVVMRNPGRYGLRIGGTIHGAVYNLRVSWAGDSGVCIESASDGTPQTSTDFYHLYSGYNWKHGMHVRTGNTVHLFSPVLEYNGRNGDPRQGNGLKMGDTGLDDDSIVTLWGSYFESNRGWDIHTGAGLVGSQHLVSMYGGFATTGGNEPRHVKSAGYGFFYGSRAAGSFMGAYLADYFGGYKTYSLDSTCKVNVLGNQGGLGSNNGGNAPEMRDLSGTIDDYDGGLVQWYDGVHDSMSLRGRYVPRIGSYSSGTPSLRLSREFAIPTSGAYSVGDLVVKWGAAANDGREPFAWRNIVAGSPGTFESLFVSRLPVDTYLLKPASAGANAVDLSYRTYGLSVRSNLTFSVGAPTAGGFTADLTGKVFTVRVDNRSGSRLTGMTWNAVYRWAGNAAPAAPVNGRSLYVTFMLDGSGIAYEQARSVDVPW